MKKLDFTPQELKRDYSGTLRGKLNRLGWESKLIVEFGEWEYMILFQPTIKPGVQRAEVLNVTEFDKDSKFTIARDSGNCGYVYYADEGWSVLTVYEDELTEIINPHSAVLTYKIVPPSRNDLIDTQEYIEDTSGG